MKRAAVLKAHSVLAWALTALAMAASACDVQTQGSRFAKVDTEFIAVPHGFVRGDIASLRSLVRSDPITHCLAVVANPLDLGALPFPEGRTDTGEPGRGQANGGNLAYASPQTEPPLLQNCVQLYVSNGGKARSCGQDNWFTLCGVGADPWRVLSALALFDIPARFCNVDALPNDAYHAVANFLLVDEGGTRWFRNPETEPAASISFADYDSLPKSGVDLQIQRLLDAQFAHIDDLRMRRKDSVDCYWFERRASGAVPTPKRRLDRTGELPYFARSKYVTHSLLGPTLPAVSTYASCALDALLLAGQPREAADAMLRSFAISLERRRRAAAPPTVSFTDEDQQRLEQRAKEIEAEMLQHVTHGDAATYAQHVEGRCDQEEQPGAFVAPIKTTITRDQLEDPNSTAAAARRCLGSLPLHGVWRPRDSLLGNYEKPLPTHDSRLITK